MGLTYPPFAGSKRMQLAAQNSPPLRMDAHGVAVGLLQGGLVQLGFPMPKTMRNGTPDGVYGHETFRNVSNFQTKYKLRVDGIAGKSTIELMDSLLTALSHPPPPTPIVIVPPTTRDYRTGTGDPTITPDPGAGVWNSSARQASYVALKFAICDVLPVAAATVGVHAVAHMAHYLRNTGSTYKIDLEDMVAKVPSAKGRFEREVNQARQFVELLPPGRTDIASRMAENGYNYKKESSDWFYAIGGYSTWGTGVATVSDGPSGRTYALDFEYRFYDRYNWDKGKAVTIAGITVTDHFMGEFHRQGLAKEFDCVGSFKRRFTWKKGEQIPSAQLSAPGGRG